MRNSRACAVATLPWLLVSMLAASAWADWPFARGTVQRDAATAEVVVTPGSYNLQLGWAEATGRYALGPVAANDRVYTRHAGYLVDGVAGKVTFEGNTSVPEPVPSGWAAVCADPNTELLYVATPGLVVEYNAQCGPTGRAYLTGEASGNTESAWDMIVWEGRLYAMRQHGIEAFDLTAASAGANSAVWEYTSSGVRSICISETTGRVYAACDGALVAIDARADECRVVDRRICGPNYLTVVEECGRGPAVYYRSSSVVVALQATALSQPPLWQMDVGQYGTGAFAYHPPTNRLLFEAGSSDQQDEVYAVNAGTGQGGLLFKAPLPVWDSPAISGDVAFVGTVDLSNQDGWLHAFDVNTGTPLWEFHVGYPITETPCISSGGVFVRAHRYGILGFFPMATQPVGWGEKSLYVWADPLEILTKGDSSAITVQLFDPTGYPVGMPGGAPDYETAVRFSASPSKPAIGSLSVTLTHTNDVGQAYSVFTSARRAGVATIVATAEQGYGSASVCVNVIDAGAPPPPPPTGTIQGTVYVGSKPARDATVNLYDFGTGDWISSTVTNRKGKYVFDATPAGTYVIECQDVYSDPAVELGPGATVTVDLHL